MNEFEREVRARKELCRGARHRVCGAKSHRCALPSDNLTENQWRARNGPVQTVRLGEPMEWTELQQRYECLRRCYLAHWLEQGMSAEKLAGLLGTDRQTLLAELARLRLPLSGGKETA